MKNRSKKIEQSIQTVIRGLNQPILIESLPDDQIETVIKSKDSAFRVAKDLLNRWNKSQNRPSDKTLKRYIEQIVDAGYKAIDLLEEALADEIDYDELSPTKYNRAILAKPTILDSTYAIEAGIMELEHQLNSQNYNLDDKEFKRGFPEKFAAGEFYPESDYHEDWYNDKKKSVKICPFGTEGKTITLEGLRITLPKVPAKKDILFSNLSKEEQYWRRLDIPDGITKDNADEFATYIYQEFRRRREGVWFMNYGEAVYIPGDYYFALQWCKMKDDGAYMNFRYAQLNMFYHMKACDVDKRCLGQLFVKSRRTGFTYVELFRMLQKVV